MHFSGCKRQPLDFRKNPQLCSIIECSFSHSFLCNFYVPHWSPFVQCKNVHQPIITSHELWTTSFQEWRLPVSSNAICYSLIRDHSHSKFEAKMHFHLCAHHRIIISKCSYFCRDGVFLFVTEKKFGQDLAVFVSKTDVNSTD